MSSRVDPDFVSELKEYGAIGVESCFNCGNCTAICPLTSDGHPFPRNTIRLAQLGLKDRILQNPDPWLCYYCGECSETCPRQAEPAESQMAMRRWLTAQYDWTGLARRFYTSKVWELGSVLFLSALVILVFILFHGPIVTEQVELNTFAPVHVVEIGDWSMAALLSFFLLTNIYRMHTFILRRGVDGRIPFRVYLTEAWQLVYHFFTQRRFAQCEAKRHWRDHLILVSGYVLMFTMIVVFLRWFQTDHIYPIYHPQRWLGYYATIALIYGAGVALWERFKKQDQMHRFSHLSDWMFPILLLLTAVSGILVHIFRYAGLAHATYYTYVIHLSIMFPMLVLEVPFGKWSHLAYRPFAIYFTAVKQKALAEQQEVRLATAGTD
jgi:heterodisulfide reductase subunit C